MPLLGSSGKTGYDRAQRIMGQFLRLPSLEGLGVGKNRLINPVIREQQ
jgi:hypothetical protein